MYVKPMFTQYKNNANMFCFLNNSLCSTITGNLYSFCCMVVICDLTI